MRLLLAGSLLLHACSEERSPDIEPALALLRSADADERFEAVVQLGGVRSKDATEALLGAIEDEDPAVRLLAGIALVAADADIADTSGEDGGNGGGAASLNPRPAPRNALSAMDRLVYADPWFAGRLLPGCLVAVRDQDERVRALALRALEVVRRTEPTDFREVARAAED